MCRLPDYLIPLNVKIGDVLDALTFQEFFSTPLLTEDGQQALLPEAARAPFAQLDEVVAKGAVTQQIWRSEFIFGQATLGLLGAMVAAEINRLFSPVEPYLFETPLIFNELSLQRYPAEYGGISPHVDGPKFQNLIALLVLGGHGELYWCKNRDGEDAVPIPCPAGNLVLLPARGYMERTNTPFHFLTEVTCERYVLGLRQNTLLPQ